MRTTAAIRGSRAAAGRLAVLIGAAWIGFSTPAGAQGSLRVIDREFTGLVEKVAPAVVRVGTGLSGVCVSRDGHILTHEMVVRQVTGGSTRTVDVTFPDQTTFAAALLDVDAGTGTALLRIEERTRFPSVRPGDPHGLEPGNLVLTVGNAFNSALESEPAVTLGVVAFVHRDEQGRPLLIETTAATNPGQSGGPFFDIDGSLVGLARSLPTDQDLATVMPIDRIVQAYRSIDAEQRVFDDPPTLKSPRTKGQILSRAFAIAARRARPFVCTVLVERARPEHTVETSDSEEGGTPPPEESPAEGGRAPAKPRRFGPLSGTVVDPEGLILAPARELDGDIESIEVVLHDGLRLPARRVAADRKVGLALLRVEPKARRSLQTGNAVPVAELEPGQFVVAVGAPHGDRGSDPFVTVGLLSARGRLDPWRNALQTDAGVNVKNAGGALVDIRGRWLGVLLPPEPPFGQNSGLGFALPAEDVPRIVDRLRTGRDIEPAYLGVTLADAPDGGGVRVVGVLEGLAADEAGVLPGDVITHLDGAAIADRRALTDRLALLSAGDAVRLGIRREGQPIDLEVTLGARPRDR